MIDAIFRGVVGRLALISLVLGLSLAIYGYTASNTVSVSRAGSGTGVVSAYSISGTPTYTLNSLTPQNIDGVTVTLSASPPAGATMKIQLRSGGSWYSCTNAGSTLTCATTSPQETITGPGTMSLVVVVAD